MVLWCTITGALGCGRIESSIPIHIKAAIALEVESRTGEQIGLVPFTTYVEIPRQLESRCCCLFGQRMVLSRTVLFIGSVLGYERTISI